MPRLAPLLRPWLLALAVAGTAAAGPPGSREARLDSLDPIPYRALKRDDFRGLRPPAQFLTGSGVMPVAVSCTYLVVSPWSRVFAVPVRTDLGTRYRARVEDLCFVAVLARSCSWWNQGHDVSPGYVLEHEQLHFAIFEVASRRLNRQVPSLAAAVDSETAAPEEVVALAQQRVGAALRQALQEAADLNLQFDRETSYGFQPDRQAAWRRRLERDLEELSGFAAPVQHLPVADESR